MSLIEALLLLLVLSRVLGEIVARFGQPAMIGEIAAGVLLGPSVLHYVHFTPEIRAIADVGVLLLAFMSGMEMDMDALWASFRGRGAWVSAMGFVMPLGFGILLGRIFGLDQTRTLFVGLCIAITALPVSIRILLDLGKLRTDVGQKIISAAVANDVASLLALGIILDVKGGAQANFLISTFWALCKALFFMSVIVIAARLAKRYTVGRFKRSRSALDRILVKVKGKESIFAIVLVFVIAFASFSEVLGLDFVVGAFFGSMLLSHQILGRKNFEEIQTTASNVTMGFLGPVFFAAIGLEFDGSGLRNWKLVIAILVVSFAGKIFGGYVGGKLARMGNDESWALGIGLNGRGVMELVIANVALSNGFISQDLFTILVLMAVVTTVATPFLLKRAFRRMGPEVSTPAATVS
ncbi:MAG TPA: cation:proton antiporter [Candidatus Deferrimicrobiaceae bacterium]|nr:cation:proton antiporter [Candidatus Deferrimicrobiaceae bacterium]